jgi:hypothetical protein
MSHTKKVNLIGNQFVDVGERKEVSIHNVESIHIDGDFNITKVGTSRGNIEPKNTTRADWVVALILRYGMIDGSHHKQWLLEQALRGLLGDKYDDVISEYNSDENYNDWDEGIAP